MRKITNKNILYIFCIEIHCYVYAFTSDCTISLNSYFPVRDEIYFIFSIYC